jgi:hypothetical protein
VCPEKDKETGMVTFNFNVEEVVEKEQDSEEDEGDWTI